MVALNHTVIGRSVARIVNVNLQHRSKPLVRTAQTDLLKGLERASVKVEVLRLNVLHRAGIGTEQYGLLVGNKGQVVHVHVARKNRQANRRLTAQLHGRQVPIRILEREELHRVPATRGRPRKGAHRLKRLVLGPLSRRHYRQVNGHRIATGGEPAVHRVAAVLWEVTRVVKPVTRIVPAHLEVHLHAEAVTARIP